MQGWEECVGWVKPNNFLSAKTVQFCARLMQKSAKSARKVTFGVVWKCKLPTYFVMLNKPSRG